jgi:hypothetical protein
MHDIIEFAGLAIGILGLIPLWREKKRHLIATALTVLVIVGAIYIFWERHEESVEQAEREVTIEKIESEMKAAVCNSRDGMNFDQFLLVVDREYDWGLVDEAIGRLQHEVLRVDSVLVPSWDASAKAPIPVRVWRISNRKYCETGGVPLF